MAKPTGRITKIAAVALGTTLVLQPVTPAFAATVSAGDSITAPNAGNTSGSGDITSNPAGDVTNGPTTGSGTTNGGAEGDTPGADSGDTSGNDDKVDAAAEVVDPGGNTVVGYGSLQEAFNNAEAGQIVRLIQDVDCSSTGVSVSKSVTFDLNGHTLKVAHGKDNHFKINSGEFTLCDSSDKNKDGTGKGIIWTYDPYVKDVTSYGAVEVCSAQFVMESGLIDMASAYNDTENQGQFGIVFAQDWEGGSVTIHGGRIRSGWYTVSGNGNSTTDTTVNIEGGVLESVSDYAIYQPQPGIVNMKDGVVYGKSGGIAMKRGTLNMTGGAVTSRGTGDTGNWGDGTGNLGAAALNTSKRYGDVSVKISGGKLVAEQKDMIVDETGNYTATIAISGGSYSSEVESKYLASRCVNFVLASARGGGFEVMPAAKAESKAYGKVTVGSVTTYYESYDDAEEAAKKIEAAGGDKPALDHVSHYVPPVTYATSVAASDRGSAKVSSGWASAGTKVTVTLAPGEGYRAAGVTVTDASGKAIEVTAGDDAGEYVFKMPSSKVTVTPLFSKAFSDVDYSAWYASSVDFVSAKGIMNGVGDTGRFGVGATLTRAELASLLWNYAEPGHGYDAKAKNATGMADVADGQWYTAAANWAVANGVINGYDNADGSRTFGPNDPVTLEQFCGVVQNLTKGGGSADLSKFLDASEVSGWAKASVSWAVSAGLVNGSDETDGLYLRATSSMPRERVAAVVANAYKVGVLG